jgi:hypothetical protein
MAKTVVSAPFPSPDDDDREAVSKLPPDPSSHKEEQPMAKSDDAVTKPVDPTTSMPAAVEVPPTPATPPPARPEPPDPFDLDSLRLGTDFSSGLGVRRVISTIPVRKPSKDEWFRRRVGDGWALQTAVLEVEKGVERSTYILARHLWTDYSGEITPAVLYVCMNRQGDLFVWRVKLPGPDGRPNTWTESALEIAKASTTTWCRMKSDMTNGIYTHFVPADDVVLPEPAWPADLSMADIMRIAFRGRLIDSVDHPVLRELRGEL